jgi:hypothetical protein
MKVLIFCFGLLLGTTATNAQNGYIRLSSDSTLSGYIKTVFDRDDHQHVLEFWRTKNDKDPVRIRKSDVEEYAIHKDTFRILKNFQPFPPADFFLDDTDAKVLQSGRIELLSVRNPYYRDKSGPLPMPVNGGTLLVITVDLFSEPIENVPVIFVLHTPRNGFMRGVPSKGEAFQDVISEFFSPVAVETFEKENGPLTIRKLKKLVAYYNEKTARKL